MARVDLVLNGRIYALSCEDGQESRLKELAVYVDSKLKELANSAHSGNEAQLMVLTALTLADEIFDQKAELTLNKIPHPGSIPRTPEEDAALAGMLDRLSDRLESVTGRLRLK
jgi:cell division protein ZapA